MITESARRSDAARRTGLGLASLVRFWQVIRLAGGRSGNASRVSWRTR
jgi:hypothetical protein